MSSTFTSFAIVGASGLVGSHILNAFLSIGVNPLVLSRTSSDKTFPPNTQVAKVDLENVDEVAKVLKEHNVEVVVSVAGTTGIPTQRPVADAAKKAGVKLFVPSEFGSVTEGVSKVPGESEESPLVQKEKFIDYLQSVGLPYTRFFIGQLSNFVPWFTGHLENGKVNVIGKGETSVSFTDPSDVGGYVAHVLTTLPSSELENRSLRIEGEGATVLELAKKLNKEIQYTDKVPGEPLNEVKNYLLGTWDSGRGSSRYDFGIKGLREGETANDNHLWAGHKWKTIADSIQ
ncbi:hypothetical protein PQX77_009743 [Marasmius sp. AFHP31]|nr:hypothetical protein PQX77_009743 [Marasmius sp. AFHP31]